VQELGFYTVDAPWETNYDVSLNVTQATGLLNDEIMLASVTHLVDYMVGIVPITIVINTDLIAVSTVSSDTAFSATTGHTNTNLLSIGVIYEDNFWSNIWDFSESTSLHTLTITGQGNLTQQVSLIPQISIKMYGVDGPYFDTELYGEFLSNFDPDLLNWDMEQNVGLNADVGAEVTIFGNALPDYNDQLVGFEQTLWSVPDELIYVSGNYQAGDTNQLLTNPVKVKVEDKSGNTWANVPVYFNVTSGGGSVSDESIMTDANGYAQTNWTMGPVVGQNTLSVSVVKANGIGITGSPMQFTANATGGGGGGQPCPGIPTVYYEGQTYNTVLIGDQCWLKENLNVGTMIPDNQNMANTGTIEKYCYNNDPSNCATYGGLYQWSEMMQYVTTPGTQGICPSDWHIPTDDEWKILEGTVDSYYPVGDLEWDGTEWRGSDAGHHLKSTTGWNNNGNGDDSFGFLALPGGFRSSGTGFDKLGASTYFWSSAEHSGSHAWYRVPTYYADEVYRSSSLKSNGFSVRCLHN
ncbi:MAG: hypothetical protein KAG99_02070, partial [Bacteroidales bacterium]|nr:hypothetical protein [Bacteroidales bacterium]